MPARKLTYQVDVDTSGAVSDLRQLGTAGADAGKDMAAGFDQAGTKSQQAIDKVITGLDQVATEARNTIHAVAQIGQSFGDGFDANAAAGLVSALRKAGAEFDDIEGKADQLAATMREMDGVRLDAVASGAHDVGTELEHTRGEADQSRSVLANMAGNTAQDLGQLGGVVGSLGVGIGQLAEYAADGNVSLSGLAHVAGPMAALAGASLVIQGISSGLADLKKRQEQYTQQQETFNQALDQTGSLQETVNNMLRDNTQLAAQPELNWWQGMMDDLPVLTGMVDDQTSAQSDLIGSLAAAGTSAQEFTFALDHGLGPFNALNAAWKDALDSGQITQEQYDLLTKQLDLYSQTALKAEVQQQNLNVVFGDGAEGLAVYTKALPTPEALAAIAQKQQDLADAAQAASEAIRAQAGAAADASAIMAGADWGQASFDAATTAMSAFFAAHDEGLHSVGELSDAYDGLHEALHNAFGEGNLPDVASLIPDMTTPEGRAVLDALDNVGQALIPSISKAFQNSHGDINAFRTDMQGLYQSTLTGLANQLGVSEDKVKALLATIGLTPSNFDTMYELNGVEDAKLKLQLLSTQIDQLPQYVQSTVQQQIILGDYTGALQTVQNAFALGAKVPVYADTTPAKSTAGQFRHDQESTPIYIPVKTFAAGGSGGFSKGSAVRSVPAAAMPAAAAVGDEPVDEFAALGAGTYPVPTTVAASAPVSVAVPAANVVVNLSAGVIGDRWDLQRWVRAATRNQARFGQTLGVTPP